MRFVVQSPTQPERVLRTLEDLGEADLVEVRIAVAYVTESGRALFNDTLQAKVGRMRWETANKLLVTCIDYGLTDPEALDAWLRVPNAKLFLQNSQLLSGRALNPTEAFHCKYYELRRGGGTSIATELERAHDRVAAVL